MMLVFVICSFHPVDLKSSWNWNLKFGFLGQHDQNTIFQTKEQKIQMS